MAEAALAGTAILGAAFILSWASELARLEISAALAVALLALIAVLPEYAVDIYFAWQAGQDPVYAHYAVANMTGANRLLIGVGWSTVVFLFWWKTRERILRLGLKDRLELGALTVATVYAVSIPFKSTLSLLDTAVLVSLFIIYIRAASRQELEEPELMGPCEVLALLPCSYRRLVTVSLFAFAAATILLSAEAFAEGLIGTGSILGIDEFFLVQWLAPLASEAPEFIIAALFALQNRADLGIRTMISSKVNQWTLLIGMIPLAYAISAGTLTPMPLDPRQTQEIMLTVAQSFFAVAILSRFEFSIQAALALLTLFTVQLVIPAWHGPFIAIYFVLGGLVLLSDRERIRSLISAVGVVFTGELRARPMRER
jgi:cation:H+ antiporter